MLSKFHLKENVSPLSFGERKGVRHKCPFTDGAVVYQARALYNLINQTFEVFNDNCPVLIKQNAKVANQNISVIEANEWTASVFPNPASEELFIRTSNSEEDLEVKITDVSGKLASVFRLKTTLFTAYLKLNLLSGVYFVTLTNQQNNYVVKKLIITK